MMRKLGYVLIASFTLLPLVAVAQPLHFERLHVSEETYESASAFDVNNNGIVDIVSGAYWYEGPDFTEKHKITEWDRVGDYWDNFSDFPVDVNGNGYMDLVVGGWFNQTFSWLENPEGRTDEEWTLHEVAEVGNIERNVFGDINGDGYMEVFPVTNPVHIFRLVRDEDGNGTGEWEQHTIRKGTGGHGFGVGDINGNGRNDIILAGGWIEAPEDTFDVDAWEWHPDWDIPMASVPMLVHDVNGDGLNDLIVGNAHDFGLWWYEQGQDDEGNRTWTQHVICDERSQYHDVRLADIDNDGELELITGKRYYAHSGNDPGAEDPLGIYYFKINNGDFERFTLDYGPNDSASGAGIFFWVTDITQNGWKDVVAPGKEGLHAFFNHGPMEETGDDN